MDLDELCKSNMSYEEKIATLLRLKEEEVERIEQYNEHIKNVKEETEKNISESNDFIEEIDTAQELLESGIYLGGMEREKNKRVKSLKRNLPFALICTPVGIYCIADYVKMIQASMIDNNFEYWSKLSDTRFAGILAGTFVCGTVGIVKTLESIVDAYDISLYSKEISSYQRRLKNK